MKYCRNCGKQIDDNAVICPYCGVQQASLTTDSGSLGWGLLGCCIPIVGLILYLVWKDDKPKTAKMAGKGALISVILGVVSYLLLFVVGIGAAMLGL